MAVQEVITTRLVGYPADTNARPLVNGLADGDQEAGLVVIRDGNNDLRPPTSAAELARIVGLSVTRASRAAGGAGGEHYGDNEPLQAMERGTMYVTSETACTAGDKCFVRHGVVSTPAGVLGSVRNDVDTADAVQIEGLVFDETLAATGVVRVRVNLPA